MTIPIARGLRNKNPMNLDYVASIKWVGLIGIEPPSPGITPRFCLFDSMMHGIRAGVIDLHTIVARGNASKTVAGIISAWAPPSENDTAAYIKFVCAHMNALPDSPVDMTDPGHVTTLADAIMRQENGSTQVDTYILSSDIQAGVLAAITQWT